MSQGPARGLRELSLVELSRDDSLKSELWLGRESWVSTRAEAVRSEIALRTSLMALPIVLIWMRWRALHLPRGRRYSAFPLVVSAPVTFGMFYALLAQSRGVADAFFAPRWSGPWLALAVMVVSSAAIDQLRHRVARRRTNDSPCLGLLLRLVNVRRLAEEHLGRLHQRLGQRRMRMDRQLEVRRGRAHLDRDHAFGDQLAGA